jgi:hypothetical protein
MAKNTSKLPQNGIGPFPSSPQFCIGKDAADTRSAAYNVLFKLVQVVQVDE